MEVKTREEAIKLLKEISLNITNDIIPIIENEPSEYDFRNASDAIAGVEDDVKVVGEFIWNNTGQE